MLNTNNTQSNKNAKIISFINMKGGVGKTTLCKEISQYLYKIKNKSILVIDIDPQSNCTQSFFEHYNIFNKYNIDINENKIIKNEDSSKLASIEHIFNKDFLVSDSEQLIIENLASKESLRFDLIPGDLRTVFMEREQSTGAAEKRLKTYIYKKKLRDKYDYIFIDCPPTYSFYTVAAMLTSDFYLVPVKPDAYSLLGLDLLDRVISDLESGNFDIFQDNHLINLGIIFTMVGSEKGFGKNIADIKSFLDEKNIYYFNSQFKFYSKLITSNLDKFITDREDTDLANQMEDICNEFEKRVGELNG